MIIFILLFKIKNLFFGRNRVLSIRIYKLRNELTICLYFRLRCSIFYRLIVQFQLKTIISIQPDSGPRVNLSGENSLILFSYKHVLFALERITVGSGRFWSNDHNIKSTKRETRRFSKHKAQIINKLIIGDQIAITLPYC